MSAPESDIETQATKIAWRCTCYNTRKTARAVTDFYDRMLAQSGVSATQFTLLGAIAILGPGPISRLAENMALDRTTLTRNLKLLQKTGWIATKPGADRRERVVSLTPEGQAAVDRATPLWRDAQSQIESSLGTDRWHRLQDDLNSLTDAVSVE